MAEAVLDASALLALLLREPGCDLVEAILPSGMTSAVIACEVATKLIDHRVPADDVADIIADLGIEIAPFTDADALLAAGLRPITRKAGLSLGDRACLALGVSTRRPVYTADRLWADLGLAIDIRLIR